MPGLTTKFRTTYNRAKLEIKDEIEELRRQAASQPTFWRRAHAVSYAVLTEHASPASLAVAVFAGVVVGCSPFIGFHLFICIVLASLLRLNIPITYLAANISMPPLAPLIAVASVQIGHFLFYGKYLKVSFHALGEGKTQFFIDWLAGGLVLGGSLGAVASGIIYLIARHVQRDSRLLASGGKTA